MYGSPVAKDMAGHECFVPDNPQNIRCEITDTFKGENIIRMIQQLQFDSMDMLIESEDSALRKSIGGIVGAI